MKIASRVLGAILIANAVLCLATSQGRVWAVVMPLCLLVAGVLQFTSPKAGLISIVIMFALSTLVVHFSMLPTWLLFRLMPQSSVLPALLAQNALVVVISMFGWLSMRRELHNNTPEDIGASRAESSA